MIVVVFASGQVPNQTKNRPDALTWPQVTFLTELGDLPLLSTSLYFEVEPTIDGSKENFECGGQGICGELAWRREGGENVDLSRTPVMQRVK